MVQPLHNRIEIPGRIPIPDEELIDDQTVLCRLAERRIRPLERRLDGPESPDRPEGMSGWMGRPVGETGGGDVAVIPRVENERSVWVRHFNGVVNQEMVAGPSPGGQPLNLQPPDVAIRGLVHQEVRADLPIIEIPAQVDVVLARCSQLNVGTVRRQHRDAIRPTGRRIHHKPLSVGPDFESTEYPQEDKTAQETVHPGAKQKRRFARAHEP